MCNCGNKRQTLPAKQTMKPAGNQNFSRHGSSTWPEVSFQYVGKTALTAGGIISGRKYRFSAPGDVQLVDKRDAQSLMSVPVLKRLE